MLAVRQLKPTATMRVQNYAGSRIKSGNCWKCSWGWDEICLRYSTIQIAF